MEREIKFRAWNVQRRKMFDWDEIYGAKSSAVFKWMQANEGGNQNILMQFVGLEDEEGKDIYEGDIVKYEILSGELCLGIVGYCKKYLSYSITIPKYDEEYFYAGNHRRIRVIGNIHENPELL